MKSSEFLPESHLTDPKIQPKPAVKMKPRKSTTINKGVVPKKVK